MVRVAHLVLGGAGFIGANLVRRLNSRGDRVVVCDDFSRGRPENLSKFIKGETDVQIIQVDCANSKLLRDCLDGVGLDFKHVWHLAANSDIGAGIIDPMIDLRRTFLTTFAILEYLREKPQTTLSFASSSAIYGDCGDDEIVENAGPLLPISNYGAMKLASEAQISAAVEAFLGRANIFRFANVVGVPATHGVLLDFVRKLRSDHTQLNVLGDGRQKKPYLHVNELVDAMLFVDRAAMGTRNIFNIGPSDAGLTVKRIAEIVRDAIAPNARIHYGSEARGWLGDIPKFRYSIDRLKALGWKPVLSSEEAVKIALAEIMRQEDTECRQ
jgi:UDP-glucose 4-epimerase